MVWRVPSRSSITTHPTLQEHKSTIRKNQVNVTYTWGSCSPGLFDYFWGQWKGLNTALQTIVHKSSLLCGLPTILEVASHPPNGPSTINRTVSGSSNDLRRHLWDCASMLDCRRCALQGWELVRWLAVAVAVMNCCLHKCNSWFALLHGLLDQKDR